MKSVSYLLFRGKNYFILNYTLNRLLFWSAVHEELREFLEDTHIYRLLRI
jgi:hypothetical protein